MPRKLKTASELAVSRGHTALGYGAVEDSTGRRKIVRKTSPEIAVLTPPKREIASATSREDRRNMSILAWMIRRHLDCVSRFTPHIRLPDANLTAKVIKLLRWHGMARNFDALQLRNRDIWMRMFEACKVISGDCGGLKVSLGRLQGVEGDRIAKPLSGPAGQKIPENVTDEGLILNPDGSIQSFCVCKRSGLKGETLEYERTVPRSEMIFGAYWPERFDANRGVSPLLTALNEAADVRETWQWLVLKAKVSALFGLAFTRTGSDDIFPTQGDPNTAAPSGEANAYTSQVAAAVKSRGIVNLDLDPGDDVKEIQSSTPNPNVVPFTRELIRSILLALDIPFTFYDSLTASFSARIADRNEYEESCEWKRDENISILDEIYGGWLLPIWAKADLFGFGKALETSGISLEEVSASLRWVPAGRPWLDRSNEMSGHILALAAGVTSTPRICSSYGDDAYEIAQEQKDYLEKAGQPLLYAQGGQIAVQAIMAGMGQKPAENAPQPQETPDEPQPSRSPAK